jgi:diguanylate cyclase (GGDEF)-like protein/PAS domain S-box-containing protein
MQAHDAEIYRSAFYAAPIGMTIVDAEGCIRAANAAFAAFTARSPAELRGMRTIDLTHPEDRDDSVDRYRSLVRGEIDTFASVKRYLRPDGETMWAQRTVAALRDADGTFQVAVAMIEDITAHVRSARALQRSEEEFRTLVEASPDAILLTDLDTRIRQANASAASLYGVKSPRELEGLYATDLCAPGERDRLQKAVELRLGAPSRVSEPLELRLHRADGATLSVEISADLVHDASGGASGFVAIVRDITARNAERAALERTRAALQLRAQHSAAIAEYGRRTIATTDLQTVMTDAVAVIAEVLDTPRVSILQLSTDGQGAQKLAATGWDDVAGRLTIPELDERSHIGYSFLHDTAIAVADYAADDRFDWHPGLRSLGVRAGMTAPIHREGAIYGLVVAHGHESTSFTEQNLSLVQNVANMVSTALDRHATDERVRFQARLLDLIEDAAIVFRLDGTIIFCNRYAQRLYGYTESELLAARIEMLGTRQSIRLLDSIRPRLLAHESWSGEMRLRRKDRSIFPAQVTHTPLFADDGTLSGIIGVAVDITERKKVEDELRRLALRDSLTGLANRMLFSDRLEHAITRARRSGESLAVLLIDLDRFKEVNDALGHDVGDVLLGQVAGRFKDSVRGSDTVARLGGDEFAVLLPGSDEDGATRAAGTLLESLSSSIVVGPHTLLAGCSIGIALFPRHGEDAPTLVRHADVAMYAAKRTGAGFSLYTPEVDPHSRERLALTSGLQTAIDSGQLHLEYQPKVMLRDRSVHHVEALIRWRHPELGTVPPETFIGIAEQTGLIRPLTLWVLDEAIHQCRLWSDIGVNVNVAVNLSAWNLQDGQLVDIVAGNLEKWDVSAAQLTLEITESALMIEPSRALETVTNLHDLGVHVSVDDFGTGYSSLSYLQRLPVDEIKIDRSFVGNMCGEDRGSGIIVRSVIDLGHNLGLQVVAEGVESSGDADLLNAMGCDLAQGYLFSPPLSPEPFLTWYRTWTALNPRLPALHRVEYPAS